MPKKSRLFIDIGQGISLMIGIPTIDSWDIKTRPRKPKRGYFGYNSQTRSLEYYDGSAWYWARMSAE